MKLSQAAMPNLEEFEDNEEENGEEGMETEDDIDEGVETENKEDTD